MAETLVVKSFVVRQEVLKKNKKTYKNVSRMYHAKSAAEAFKVLAERLKPGIYSVYEVPGFDDADGT